MRPSRGFASGSEPATSRRKGKAVAIARKQADDCACNNALSCDARSFELLLIFPRNYEVNARGFEGIRSISRSFIRS